MCFVIDPKAPKPTRKFAYKILQAGLHKGRVIFTSPYKMRGTRWYLNRAKHLHKDACVRQPGLWSEQSQSYEGLYVHSTRKRAFEAVKGTYSSLVIFKVEALPKDYIHSSGPDEDNLSGRASTYRRLKPVKLVGWSACAHFDRGVVASLEKYKAKQEKNS